jgi:hypothetical protein
MFVFHSFIAEKIIRISGQSVPAPLNFSKKRNVVNLTGVYPCPFLKKAPGSAKAAPPRAGPMI